MRPGVNLPIVDFLCDLPATALAGSIFAADRRPDNATSIFVLVPATSGNTATLWWINIAAKSIQQLPTPTFAATSVVGAGTAMIYDESMARLWLFNSETGAPWARFQYLEISIAGFGAGWQARNTATLGLAVPWRTDANLCHPCTAISAAATGADDVIWLNGDNGDMNSVNVPSSIAWFSIAGNAWTVAGAGAARAVAPAAGSCLQWHPSREGVLYSLRGGGSNTMDAYNIATDAWAAAPLIPGVETWTAGTETWPVLYGVNPLVLMAQGGKVKIVTLGLFGNASSIGSFCEIDGADGVAHLGNGLIVYRVGEKVYVVIRPHSGKAIQRIRPIL